MLGVDPNTVGTCKLDLAFCNLARLMRGPAKINIAIVYLWLENWLLLRNTDIIFYVNI